MKILRYSKDRNAPAYGVLEPDGAIRRLDRSPFELAGGEQRPGPVVAHFDDVRVLPPVTPSKVVMVGANYFSHLEGTPPPEFPMLFLKPPTAVIGHGDTIRVPRIAGPEVDYEAELTVVIGRQTPRHVPESEALSYVLGYTVGNDVSAREWQLKEMKTGVLLRGKGFDTFAPIGPVVETELDPDDVTIEARVNGVLGHRVRTKGDMIFSVRALIADMTRAFTLLPGDVIMTGTTAYGSIKAGDVVEMTIEGIGTLRNVVADEE
jgi:2-keto-4-pentenoate hydratase/2-oxohepta-3-ene-1,7-dioic acid hydratase in catechol pathway